MFTNSHSIGQILIGFFVGLFFAQLLSNLKSDHRDVCFLDASQIQQLKVSTPPHTSLNGGNKNNNCPVCEECQECPQPTKCPVVVPPPPAPTCPPIIPPPPAPTCPPAVAQPAQQKCPTCLFPTRDNIVKTMNGETTDVPILPFPPQVPDTIQILFRGPKGVAVSPYTLIQDNAATSWPLDLQGWNGGDPELVDLIRAVKPKFAIEVGSWKGFSTSRLAHAIKENHREHVTANGGVDDPKQRPLLIAVDTWLGAVEFWLFVIRRGGFDPERFLYPLNGYPHVYYQFLANMVQQGLSDTVIPMVQGSIPAAKYFYEVKFFAQYIYIDASHETEDVFLDMCAYFNLLDGPDAVMVGDDVGWPSVMVAVNRFFERYCGSNKPHIGHNKWWLFKRECTGAVPIIKADI